ncbi:ATP-binding cassette domain-containing protein [Georgenia thermotolerans]|uniref:ATP-binding cassette domain-containing protein n=1 Tax=Georgenia thermotolerans TaxID=527326 RepID=A0A7J5UI92_9MICO|nr:ATP-binding cassette domain-containing protein [Georgenia thermotolerans]KAE8762081.1 ATP-binding cassette domain-containing protein [Georgenia thermotolerans]
MSLAKIRNAIDEGQVRDAMALVGLDPDLPQKARHYSLGMKQRLGLAQAIMEDQPGMVLDEPFNALDEETVTEMRQLLRSLVDDGKPLVMTSHPKTTSTSSATAPTASGVDTSRPSANSRAAGRPAALTCDAWHLSVDWPPHSLGSGRAAGGDLPRFTDRPVPDSR